jgi:2,4-dienoyl-CoA reductase-like NADH-dependent reductase (Old Yellow Enzyme family)
LFHGGVRVDPKLNGRAAWSASAVEEDGVTPHAASEAEIARVIGDFRAAAVRAQTAGFQGVELHGAHGYLFGQFLSTWNNRRTDAWGGALENRARLLVQTLREIRSAVRPDFVVGVRLSPENWGHAKGLDLDESLQVARWLAEAGLDYLHLSLWKASAPTKKRPDQHPVTLFKRELQGRVPIVVAGQIWTREEAESVVVLGASGVALGLAAIANPEWPKGIRASAWQPDRPPFSAQQLLERGLSPAFADNMALWWPDFVIRS